MSTGFSVTPIPGWTEYNRAWYPPASIPQSVPSNVTSTVNNTVSNLGGSFSKGLYWLDGNWCNDVMQEFNRYAKTSGEGSRLSKISEFGWKDAIDKQYTMDLMSKDVSKVVGSSDVQKGINDALKNVPKKADVRTFTGVDKAGKAFSHKIDMTQIARQKAAMKPIREAVLKQYGVKSLKEISDPIQRKAVARAISNQAKGAAKTGIFAGLKKLLCKIPGAKFVGRHFGPLLILATSLPAIWTGFKEGGCGEGFKEILRTGLQQGAYIASMFLAGAVLGLSGGWLIAAGLAGSMALGWGVDKILGKSINEQKAEAEEEQAKQAQQIAQAGNYSSYNQNLRNDPEMKVINNMVAQRGRMDLSLPSMPMYG